MNEIVREMFHGRCAECGGQGSDVHEIIPRSRGRWTLTIDNQVLLCRKCHDKFHAIGASVANVERMQNIRAKALARWNPSQTKN